MRRARPRRRLRLAIPLVSPVFIQSLVATTLGRRPACGHHATALAAILQGCRSCNRRFVLDSHEVLPCLDPGRGKVESGGGITITHMPVRLWTSAPSRACCVVRSHVAKPNLPLSERCRLGGRIQFDGAIAYVCPHPIVDASCVEPIPDAADGGASAGESAGVRAGRSSRWR